MEHKIQFKCLQCGNCCGEGFIYLKPGEASRMAVKLGMHAGVFKKKYTAFFLFLGRALKWQKDGFCVFMKGNKCSIYEARPSQCRTWPYWKKLLKNKLNLESAAVYCKGIEIKTPLK